MSTNEIDFQSVSSSKVLQSQSIFGNTILNEPELDATKGFFIELILTIFLVTTYFAVKDPNRNRSHYGSTAIGFTVFVSHLSFVSVEEF